MKILSWNVNGIRARTKAGMVGALKAMDPDILCLQEVRSNIDQIPQELLTFLNEEYPCWFLNRHDTPGYAGVLCASKIPFVGLQSLGEHGRIIVAEYEEFILINVYSPNAGRDLERLEHRLGWEKELLNFIRNQTKPIILCGDMNVAPEKIDSNTYSKAGTSKEERQAFAKLKNEGNLIDVFRSMDKIHTTHTWLSRTPGKGMRIDHFLISKEINHCKKTFSVFVSDKLRCRSDHRPIMLDIKI